MKAKLKSHFLAFGPRRWVVFTVISLIITDIINCWYLKIYWLKKGVSERMVEQSIAQSGYLIEDFAQSTISEMTGFVNNTFYFFLFIILANNYFFYCFYLRKKLWAQGYVLFYVLSAAVFSVSFIVDNVDLGVGWIIYNILSIPFYIYLFLGVKMLKCETTLVNEKKAR
jgi:hypothetical protein